ncbi:hypothetical protein HOY82DRAFT_618472 [Tuber indicum]|nr:hypothetical protein HOY82DRAFT_618472 [Tuber indicum]
MSTSTATELETNPDSSGWVSNPSGSEETEGSDRTQAMNFDSDIKWIAATHPRTGDMELESSSPTVRSSTHISENSNSPMEESEQSNPVRRRQPVKTYGCLGQSRFVNIEGDLSRKARKQLVSFMTTKSARK